MGLMTAREDGSRPGVVLVGLALLPLALVLLFGLSALLGAESKHFANIGLALLTGSLAAIPIILDQGRAAKDRHILFTLISLGWGGYYALPVFTRYLLDGGYDASAITQITAVTPSELADAQIVALIALLMMFIGYGTPIGRAASVAFPTPRHEWSLGSCLGVAVIVIPLGWAIYLGGQFGLIPRRAGSGVLGVLAASTLYGIALLTLTYLKYRSQSALVLLGLAVPPTMAFNFFTGSKMLFFAPLFMIVITNALVTRRIKFRWIVAGVTALALFYPIATFYREVVQEGNTKGAIDVLQAPGDALNRVSSYAGKADFGEYFVAGLQMTGKRLNAIAITSFIVRDTPDRVPYQGGWTIGYIFLSYIPRVLWPGKPETTIGQWVTDHYMGGAGVRSNTGPSWTGELYFNFGIGGVIVGMLLLGVYFRVLHEKFYTSDATIPAIWLGVMFVYLTLPTMGGGLISPINSLGYYGGLVMLIHGVVRTLSGTWVKQAGQPTPHAPAAPLRATSGA